MVEQNDGSKTRRNLILLKYLKSAVRKTNDSDALNQRSLSGLKKYIFDRLAKNDGGLKYELPIMNYTLHSNVMSLDEEKGSCVDGDTSSIRYVKHEKTRDKVYKKRAGKVLKAVIAEDPFGKLLPEEVVNWLCEEFAREWAAYSGVVLGGITLHVDKEFGKIYSSTHCEGDFNSCMVNKGYHTFYDKLDCNAAYLTNDNGKIIARCIIFNQIYDSYTGEAYRFAERQYSRGGDEVLKRMLIDMLIKENRIDCYKVIGASCHEPTSIVDIHGNSLSDRIFYIDAPLDYNSTLSYQDTFKWLNAYNERAWNTSDVDYDYELDHTRGWIGASEDDDDDDERPYSDYTEEYCAYVVTVYVHGTEMTCDENCLDDFVEIGTDLVHKDDVMTCSHCGKKYDMYEENYESDNGYNYCCEECRDAAEEKYRKEHWYYSDFDGGHFPELSMLTSYWQWDGEEYVKKTISKITLQIQLDNGSFVMRDGEAYNESIKENIYEPA